MYSTRRDFGKVAFAGLSTARALAKVNSTVSGVRLGAQTYSFREFDHDGIVEAIIKAMAEVGLGECEIYSPQLELASAVATGGGRAAQNDPARLKACEDLRNWRLTVPMVAGYDPVEYIQTHHGHIVLLHLKDRKKATGVNCARGEGDVPIKLVLSLLKEKKYPIPAFIEYEYRGAGSAEAEMKKGFQYCIEALA